MPAQVNRNDPVVRREVLELWREVGVITAPAMHEEYRRTAGTLLPIRQPHTVTRKELHSNLPPGSEVRERATTYRR